MTTRILGVDPGTRKMGAGVIEAEGNRYRLVHFEVMSFKPALSLTRRLKQIYDTLSEVIKVYRPSVLALENVFYGRDVRAMIKIGEARACAMLAASGHGLEVVEYPPARVKQAVSGNGRAVKEQVQHMVQRLLNMDKLPSPDGADALAVAICHLHSRPASAKSVLGGLKAGRAGRRGQWTLKKARPFISREKP